VLPYEVAHDIVATILESDVGDRIRPDQLDYADTLPAVVISISTERRDDGLAENFAHEYEVRVTIYSATRAEADELADELADEADGSEYEDDDGYVWYAFAEQTLRAANVVDAESSQPIYVAEVVLTLMRAGT